MFSVPFLFSAHRKRRFSLQNYSKWIFLSNLIWRLWHLEWIWCYGCLLVAHKKAREVVKNLSEFTTLVAVARPSWNRRPGWASWRILVNAASNDGWSVDLNCFCDCFVCCYCCGDVKCWDRTVEADLKCRQWSSRLQERLSACDRHHDSAEFAADCDRTPFAIDSFLLAHLARHK